MFLQFFTSRRGPGYCYPLGSVHPVPDELARKFLADKSAKQVPPPARPSLAELSRSAGFDVEAVFRRQAEAEAKAAA